MLKQEEKVFFVTNNHHLDLVGVDVGVGEYLSVKENDFLEKARDEKLDVYDDEPFKVMFREGTAEVGGKEDVRDYLTGALDGEKDIIFSLRAEQKIDQSAQFINDTISGEISLDNFGPFVKFYSLIEDRGVDNISLAYRGVGDTLEEAYENVSPFMVYINGQDFAILGFDDEPRVETIEGSEDFVQGILNNLENVDAGFDGAAALGDSENQWIYASRDKDYVELTEMM